MKTRIKGKFKKDEIKKTLKSLSFYEEVHKSAENKAIYMKKTNINQLLTVAIQDGKNGYDDIITINLRLNRRQQINVLLSRIVAFILSLIIFLIFVIILRPMMGIGDIPLFMFYFFFLVPLKHLWYFTKENCYIKSEAKIVENKILDFEKE